MTTKMETVSLNAGFGNKWVLHDVSLAIPEHAVTAIIGPSGCGKTTILRCLNRLHEETPQARRTGQVLLDGRNIDHQDVTSVRCRVGMVFQRPTPFPHMSIYNNVAAGPRLLGVPPGPIRDRAVVSALVQAGLFEEVAENIDALGTSLSGGQQQRLCIARALAVEPEVLLMDEPCSALDPLSTERIESLIAHLKERYTLVVVTHNLAQAKRIADRTAFFHLGRLVEVGTTRKIFEEPKETLTANYVSGRFG